jgi:acyl-CoA synthetase (AMP-forming)/AMP-acid ligase II
MLDALIVSGIELGGFFGNVLSAGAQLSERTAHEFRRRTGVVVRALYGTTETGGITIASTEEGLAHNGVGCPMAGVEVDIQNFDGASHLGEGVGHVRVKSSSMMAGYASKTELLADAIQDGWFQTGDLGKKDAAGCVHLIGRASDVINVSGLKVVPGDVEAVLSQLSGVKEVKVYAGKRRDGTQFVKAAIYAPALRIESVKSYCEDQFVYYKRPEEIVMLEQPLPRTAAGKILKANLP